MMAHVQGQLGKCGRGATPESPCRRLRPRGRQRTRVWWLGAVLLSLATIFQLSVIATCDQTSSSTHNPVKDPAWRRMGGLSETTANNEQELINKILRDDTPSAGSDFQYARPPPPALVKSPDSNVTATDEAKPTPQSAGGNGKINQSRSKEEQEAFNKRLHLQQETRRRRRAVNVVVNTIFSRSSNGGRRSSESVNSNFLLKSILTEIDHCLSDKCTRDKLHRLSTENLPQLLQNSSQPSYANVTQLDLSDSALSSLPHRTMEAIVAKLPNIELVDLSINQLKSANLTLSGRVAFLNFSENQLTRFQLQNSSPRDETRLAYLDVSHNNLTGNRDTVLGQCCANLVMLDLSHNHLVDLSFLRGSTKGLRVLNLAYNHLQRIGRDAFSDSGHLEVLSLAHNLVAEIENETFASLQTLQYLDLSDNHLGASSIRALQGIPDLIGLSLARNPQLGDALQGFVASWSLKELDISATGLCEIPAALAQSVRTLNLAHNHFQMIRCGDLDSYPLLYNLDLSYCDVAEIEDDALGRLEMLATLNLNQNALRQVPISLPVNLIALHLEHNNIMELQANRFAHLANLKVLSLSGNKIQYLPALPLRKLVVLNLVSAELHGLSQLVVQTSPHLKDLRLDNNPVKCADLLGIAEWATPCKDVGAGERHSAVTDYHDLDDEDLLELTEENEKDHLKYLLDYVASKRKNGERPPQLLSSTAVDKEHFCRSTTQRVPAAAATTATPATHLNATKNARVTPAATLARNKSFRADAARGTDTGETEQISSNLPNPPFRQTVTLPPPTIIKTLPPPLTTPTTTGATTSTMSSSEDRPNAKNNRKAGGILPMRQNNGSLQITDHLNSNKRNDRDDDATNVNEEKATKSANEILATDTSAKSSSAHLSRNNEASEAAAAKSSESVAIKLANNKSANRASDNVESPVLVANASRTAADGQGSNNNDNNNVKSRKSLNRVNNKKLIKLTDSSRNRKLMPFIGDTGPRTKISTVSGTTAVVMFAQQSSTAAPERSEPIKVSPPTTTATTTPEKAIENKDTSLVMTTTSTKSPVTTTTATSTSPTGMDRVTAPLHNDTKTTRAPGGRSFEQMSLITMSPAVPEKSLPISSKQIISEAGKTAVTQDEVHNLPLSPGENSTAETFATTTAATTAAVVVAQPERVVNESVEMRKKLPKTAPAEPKMLDDDSKQVTNGKLMGDAETTTATIPREAEEEQPAKGLIEDTSLPGDTQDDDDNPLLKLWQQSSTHLSHKTKAVDDDDTTRDTMPPEASPFAYDSDTEAQEEASTSFSRAGDVNEGKNLIITKSGSSDNKNTTPTITRSPGASLKSETILINDRNNDDKDRDDNSAGGKNFAARETPNEDSGGGGGGDGTVDVLKLNPSEENGKIYVAENSLSVAELVLPTASLKDPQPTDSLRNANNNKPRGDTNRRLDKLSQLNTNSIHVDREEGNWRPGTSPREQQQQQPWNEHIKDDGRRNGHGEGDNGTDDANSDNYHHRQPHPGLYIVIGASFGIVLSIGLFRCKRSLSHRHYPLPLDSGLMCGGGGDINQTYTQRHRHTNRFSGDDHVFVDSRGWWDWSSRKDVRPAGAAGMDHGQNQQQHPPRREGESFESVVDNFRARQQRLASTDNGGGCGGGGNGGVMEDDHYRCTNWRNRAADTDKCDANFVDVQLTPKLERKSVKFDLLPMKILSPNDQPFHPIMTSDCDYATENNNSSRGGGSNSGCDMGTGPVLADRSNKSSPLDLW